MVKILTKWACGRWACVSDRLIVQILYYFRVSKNALLKDQRVILLFFSQQKIPTRFAHFCPTQSSDHKRERIEPNIGTFTHWHSRNKFVNKRQRNNL